MWWIFNFPVLNNFPLMLLYYIIVRIKNFLKFKSMIRSQEGKMLNARINKAEINDKRGWEEKVESLLARAPFRKKISPLFQFLVTYFEAHSHIIKWHWYRVRGSDHNYVWKWIFSSNYCIIPLVCWPPISQCHIVKVSCLYSHLRKKKKKKRNTNCLIRSIKFYIDARVYDFFPFIIPFFFSFSFLLFQIHVHIHEILHRDNAKLRAKFFIHLTHPIFHGNRRTVQEKCLLENVKNWYPATLLKYISVKSMFHVVLRIFDTHLKKKEREKREEREKNDKNFHVYIYMYTVSLKSGTVIWKKKIIWKEKFRS